MFAYRKNYHYYFTLTADQALIGYCKIIAEINRNKYVMRYRSEPRLTDQGDTDFKVGVYSFLFMCECSVMFRCCFMQVSILECLPVIMLL